MPLTIRRGVRATLYVIVGLGLGALLVSLGIAIAERGPPTEVLSQSDAGAQVASHDNRIFLYYQVNRTRLCRVETARWLFTMVDHENDRHQVEKVRAMVQLEPGSAVPVSDVGVSSFIISIPLPAGLWPAPWFLLTRSIDYCGPFAWFAPTRRETVPIPIDLERARAVPEVPITAVTPAGKTIIRGRSPLTR